MQVVLNVKDRTAGSGHNREVVTLYTCIQVATRTGSTAQHGSS